MGISRNTDERSVWLNNHTGEELNFTNFTDINDYLTTWDEYNYYGYYDDDPETKEYFYQYTEELYDYFADYRSQADFATIEPDGTWTHFSQSATLICIYGELKEHFAFIWNT